MPVGIRRGERNVQITNSRESRGKHWHKLGRKRKGTQSYLEMREDGTVNPKAVLNYLSHPNLFDFYLGRASDTLERLIYSLVRIHNS